MEVLDGVRVVEIFLFSLFFFLFFKNKIERAGLADRFISSPLDAKSDDISFMLYCTKNGSY